jgi:hypothetical protein
LACDKLPAANAVPMMQCNTVQRAVARPKGT